MNATLRPQWFIDKFYKEYPEDDLRLTLAKVYTYADVRRVNRDKLIDLYLYTFTEPSSSERVLSSLKKQRLGVHFGIRTKDPEEMV